MQSAVKCTCANGTCAASSTFSVAAFPGNKQKSRKWCKVLYGYKEQLYHDSMAVKQKKGARFCMPMCNNTVGQWVIVILMLDYLINFLLIIVDVTVNFCLSSSLYTLSILIYLLVLYNLHMHWLVLVNE